MSATSDRASSLSPLQRALSAAAGASLTVLATMPLEVIKTRMQAEPMARAVLAEGAAARAAAHGAGAGAAAAAAAAAAAPLARTPLLSALETATALVRAEGARALWRGLAPSLLMAVPSQVVYFSIYDPARARLERAGGRGSALAAVAPALAGMCARALTATAVAPLELLRTLAMARTDARGQPMLGALRAEVARGGGVRTLWRGWVPTLVRDVPFSGLYWFSYEALRDALRAPAPRRSRASEWAAAFAAGLGAGAFAAFATTPIDVVKTRRQLTRAAAGAAAPPRLFAELVLIARAEGARGLFAGAALRVARVGPACAVMISTYESSKLFLAD